MSSQLSLVLAACLPLLSLFDAGRNVDWQGLVLIIAGGFSVLALALSHKITRRQLPTVAVILIGTFVVGCLISLAVNPHKSYDLFGAPYLRLGSLGLLACISCGVLISRLPAQMLIKYIYIGICTLAGLSIPYSLIEFHSLFRIGGMFAQPDILACFLGVGLLLGLALFRSYPGRRKLLIGTQFALMLLLLLTQTRAVIVLVIILGLIWQLQHYGREYLRLDLIFGTAALVLLVGFHHFVPNRLTSTAYASESINYRLDLQASALRSTIERPLWGYGPGNLADALACPKLHYPDLQKTCRQGYYFSSSHNIFIDRVLTIGWFGGLSFIGLALLAIYKGFRAKPEVRIMVYAVMLITAYYLTNVTNITLELLYWVLLLSCLSRASA